MCIFMYDVYGIVKVEKYGNNKGRSFISVSHVIPPILPMYAKTREPEDKHCASQCIQYN